MTHGIDVYENGEKEAMREICNKILCSVHLKEVDEFLKRLSEKPSIDVTDAFAVKSLMAIEEFQKEYDKKENEK